MNDRYHITLDIDQQQKEQLKIKAIREQKSVRKLVTELVINKLKENK